MKPKLQIVLITLVIINLIWSLVLTIVTDSLLERTAIIYTDKSLPFDEIRAREIKIVNEKNQDCISLWCSDDSKVASITFYDPDGSNAMRLYNFYDVTERGVEVNQKTTLKSVPAYPGIKISTGITEPKITIRDSLGAGSDLSAGRYKEHY